MIIDYDPKEYIITFGPNIFTGFAPGTAFSVERSEETFKKTIGITGEGTRTRIRDRSARATAMILSTSSFNSILSAIHLLDEASGSGVLPMLIKNGIGSTVLFAAQAWIVKPPKLDIADEESPSEWMFDMADVEWFTGGGNRNG